ncbi:MAG: hypothetical protein QW478_04925 [Candidatus Micrarchaeaceae archaeon]
MLESKRIRLNILGNPTPIPNKIEQPLLFCIKNDFLQGKELLKVVKYINEKYDYITASFSYTENGIENIIYIELWNQNCIDSFENKHLKMNIQEYSKEQLRDIGKIKKLSLKKFLFYDFNLAEDFIEEDIQYAVIAIFSKNK